MKILIVSLLLIILLASCAPAQTPMSPEVSETVATDVPSAPAPTATQQTEGAIIFFYSYSDDIPRSFFQGTDVRSETVTFIRTDGVWNSAELKPQIKDLGPLYRIYPSKPLSNNVGSCGINTVNTDDMTTKVIVQPICDTIQSEESATIEIGIQNCDKDSFDNLICGISTESGTLRYSLNEEQNKFQFVVEGSYNYIYEEWIRLALNGLGFDPLPDNFFDKIMPGQNNVILKTNP